MALFIVRHQHDADRCPATEPFAGALLLNYLSRPNVRSHGVEIRGEAVVEGEHTLYMIVECGDAGRVREFMEPFAQAGSVDVYPASTCAGSSRGAAARRRHPWSTVPSLRSIPRRHPNTRSTRALLCIARTRSTARRRFRR